MGDRRTKHYLVVVEHLLQAAPEDLVHTVVVACAEVNAQMDALQKIYFANDFVLLVDFRLGCSGNFACH